MDLRYLYEILDMNIFIYRLCFIIIGNMFKYYNLWYKYDILPSLLVFYL
jgi:hypothetical protein